MDVHKLDWNITDIRAINFSYYLHKAIGIKVLKYSV